MSSASSTPKGSKQAVPTVRKVHILLQGKGGVGKSLVAALLAQYYLEKKADVMAIDTDPVNATFSGYEAFNAHRIEILEHEEVNPRRFDEMIDLFFKEDKHFVVDNGSNSFLPLLKYLVENEAIPVIASTGKQCIVHSVITAGQAFEDTLTGFEELARKLPPEAQLIVWLNEFWGPVESDGKTFEEMRVYAKHRDRINGIVPIPRQQSATFGEDFKGILQKKLTFAQAIADPGLSVMVRQRLTMIRRAIFKGMDLVL